MSAMSIESVQSLIRDIPDFPKPGIVFKDISPLLLDPEAFRFVIETLSDHIAPEKPDVIVGPESRGFIFGVAVAQRLKVGFVPIRKPGKLPAETSSRSYELEYGTDTIEIHTDAITTGQRVCLVDDVLATGGTMQACCGLVEDLGGEVTSCAFLMELSFLPGREKLDGRTIHNLLSY